MATDWVPASVKRTGVGARFAAAARESVRRIKVIFSGAKGVGKTSIINALSGRAVESTASTVGADFWTLDAAVGKGEDLVRLRVNVWDLSGDEAFSEVRAELYRPNNGEPQCLVMVYDVCIPSTFAALPTFAAEASKSGFGGYPVFVVGNRSGVASKPRKVFSQDGERWATSRGYRHFEVSLPSGDGLRLFEMEVYPAAAAAAVREDTENASQRGGQGAANGGPSDPAPGMTGRSKTTDAFGDAGDGLSRSNDAGVRLPKGATFEKLSVRELKALIEEFGLSHADCLTRQDLIDKLRNRTQKAAAGKGTSSPTPTDIFRVSANVSEDDDSRREGVIAEVRAWSTNRSLFDMLNQIVGSEDGVVSARSTFQEVNRAYKRAVLRIHPDKLGDIGDTDGQTRATEMFKAVNSAFIRYKETHEARS